MHNIIICILNNYLHGLDKPKWFTHSIDGLQWLLTNVLVWFYDKSDYIRTQLISQNTLPAEVEQLVQHTKFPSAIILYLKIKIVVSTQTPTRKDLSFVNGLHHCQTVVNRQTKQKCWSHSEEFLEYSEPVSVRACSASSIHRTKISPTLSPSFEPWRQVEVSFSLSSKQFSCQKKL